METWNNFNFIAINFECIFGNQSFLKGILSIGKNNWFNCRADTIAQVAADTIAQIITDTIARGGLFFANRCLGYSRQLMAIA
jgi:hypothetical protein